MSASWKTKHGLRRVRVEPPTIDEAIFAAEGVTDVVEEQIRIAASLMEIPVEEVRTRIRRGYRGGHDLGRRGGSNVVVERKGLRRSHERRT
jgi:hypothetical protein